MSLVHRLVRFSFVRSLYDLWIGYSSIDNTAGQGDSAFHNSYYASANLLWNPAGSLNVGIEYLFGTHRLKSGADAHASRLQFAAKYDLFRRRALEP